MGERFAFRDALRADAELRAEYQQLKEELAAAHLENGPAYTVASGSSSPGSSPPPASGWATAALNGCGGLARAG